MAKKKKATLKSAVNRGFATTSTPSKRPDNSNPNSGQNTAGTSTPSEEEKRNIAQAISEIVIGGSVQNGDENDGRDSPIDTAFDPEKEAEQALQNLVERLRERVDKEVARVWKNIEFDRRQSKQLPIFELDSKLHDEVIALYNTKSTILPNTSEEDLSSLLEQVAPSSAASDLFQKALITHFLLLKLGFSTQQAVSAISNCQSVGDIDDCVAWLASNLSFAELDAADRKLEGKPPLKKHTQNGKQNGSENTNGSEAKEEGEEEDEDEMDTTRPPIHDGFTFERQVNIQPANRRNGTSISASLPVSAATTPMELSPEIETQIGVSNTFAKTTLASLDNREVIDALEDPVQSYARARLYVIDTERASVKLEKVAKGIAEGSSPPLDEARRALIRVKTQARGIIDECQDSRDWNRTLADRLFLKLKMEAEDEHAKEETVVKKEPTAANGKKEEVPDDLDQRSQASSDDDGLFGDMLDEQPQEITDTSTQTIVRLRDLAPEALKAGGSKSPKVLLSDALRRADPYATSRFEPVATGGRMYRSRLTLRWSINKTESVIDVYTMTTMATGSQSSSDDIVAVAALMCIEARPVYKTLASGWRDWWNELEEKRQEERDRRSRITFRRLLEALQERLKEENIKGEEKRRRLQSLPARLAVQEENLPDTAAPIPTIEKAPDQNAMHVWESKRASPGYQKMLPGRQNLPIFAFQQHILEVLSQNQVFVLSGETGCGKSTQVPAYILEDCLSRGLPCKVYVTEPRRISAISLAERVSSEMGEAKGSVGKSDSLIGSAVRLESNIGRNARLVYATTGIVLRMLEGGRLEGVTHVILDEVHERSIESDFLLIILKSLMEARPELKVILMSATLNAERISDYFGGCITVEVPGRTFPVDVRWLEDAVELCDYTLEDGSPYARRPKQWQVMKGNQARLQQTPDDDLANDDDDDDEENGDEGGNISAAKYRPKTIETLDRMDEYTVNHDLIISLLERMCFQEQALIPYSAAILIFLPGIAEIRKLNDLLQVHPAFGSNNFQLFPLHSTISSENQSLVFHLPPPGIRKIVLSTNIAETGITIPDITCVIDTGKHREMRFDEKRQMSKLTECFVAKSNAKQRRGRAGRVQNGICWHLFTRHRHDQYLAEHPLPEMLRLSLQDLALKLKVMRIQIGTTIEDALSKALDPPTSVNIQRSVSSLIEIKALTSTEEITPLGRHLAKIPLDVHMGKFLLIACSLQILDSALTIAATLNSKSPFANPFGRELEARNAKKSFDFGDNDFIAIVRAFNSFKVATKNGVVKQFCSKTFLSQNNLIQIEELRQQYMTYLLDSGFVSVDDETRRDIVGARFRYNSAKTKFLAVPESLNTNAASLAMINAALLSALYPKLLVIDGKTAGLRTLTNGAPASIHPGSVNFKMKLYHLPKGINHLVYFTLFQSRKLYASEVGVVEDKAILMFCGDADFKVRYQR
jgi:ATP-dependent RNA helicase DHX29